MPNPAIDTLALAYENLHAASRVWALAAEGGAASDDDGLFVASSGVPIRSFNRAYFTRDVRDATLQRLATYMEQRGVPFRITAPSTIDVPDAALARAGLEQHGGIPCLVLEALSVTAPASDPLSIERVADERTLRAHVEVVASAFGWPPDLLARVFTTRLLETAGWYGFVGYVDGRPVATSQLLVHQGVAGIYYVGTLEPHRRRGFGEAMTARAVREGSAAGCSVASLQASPMGLPIYERMGFRQVDYYRTFNLAGQASA
jgi:ribosomal protein S18 acetylase RimI-like enzyme